MRSSRHHRRKPKKALPENAPLANALTAGQFEQSAADTLSTPLNNADLLAQPEATALAVTAPTVVRIADVPAAASPTYLDLLMRVLAAARSHKHTQLKVDPPPALLQNSRKLLLLENRTTEHAALALKPENALDFTEANAIVVTTLVVNAPTVNESEANAPKANALVVITLVANAPEANALTVNAPPIERIADAPTAASPTYLGVLMGKPGKKASETGQLTDVSVKSLAEHFPALLCASLPLETSYHHRHLH